MTTKDEIRFVLIQLMAMEHATGKQVAEYVGVSPQAVSAWRTGKSSIEIDRLPALCEFFGITVNDFFGMVDKNAEAPTLSVEERKLIEYYRHVPRHCQQAILANAKALTEFEHQSDEGVEY